MGAGLSTTGESLWRVLERRIYRQFSTFDVENLAIAGFDTTISCVGSSDLNAFRRFDPDLYTVLANAQYGKANVQSRDQNLFLNLS
jgi:hypothetical protein